MRSRTADQRKGIFGEGKKGSDTLLGDTPYRLIEPSQHCLTQWPLSFRDLATHTAIQAPMCSLIHTNLLPPHIRRPYSSPTGCILYIHKRKGTQIFLLWKQIPTGAREFVREFSSGAPTLILCELNMGHPSLILFTYDQHHRWSAFFTGLTAFDCLKINISSYK